MIKGEFHCTRGDYMQHKPYISAAGFLGQGVNVRASAGSLSEGLQKTSI